MLAICKLICNFFKYFILMVLSLMNIVVALRLVAVGFAALVVGGCQSGGVSGTAGRVADVAMAAIGLKKPEQAPQPRMLPLRLNASYSLNADAAGRGLSVVTKIYKLKDANSFLQTSYETFVTGDKDKGALGGDLIEVEEVLLVPGQHYASVERLPPEAAFLGVVVLFREPSPQHWRLAIRETDIPKSGITFGVQACAVKLIEGGSVERAAGAPARCEK